MRIDDIPNAKSTLTPIESNSRHELWNGMLLEHKSITGSGDDAVGWVCKECFSSLSKHLLPRLSLANNLWVGKIPHILMMLTLPEELLVARYYPRCYIIKLYLKNGDRANPAHLQSAIAGNVSLYGMDTQNIVNMLEGQIMPQSVSILASVLAITFIGSKKLPKDWLKSTFRIHRRVVYEALIWLKEHNVSYQDIEISRERIEVLPDDDVPSEILSVIHHEPNDEVAYQESFSFAPENTQEGKSNCY